MECGVSEQEGRTCKLSIGLAGTLLVSACKGNQANGKEARTLTP